MILPRAAVAAVSLFVARALYASCAAPTFDTPPFQNAGPVPEVMTFANVNGDAWHDLVVGNLLDADGHGGLAVLRGGSGGSFAEPEMYFPDASIEAVAAADFDGDGDDDLVVLDNTNSKLLVL